MVGAARVALVHDYLLVMRGAERTFAAIADCYPGADVHALLFDPETIGDRFAGHRVRASGLQRVGVGQENFRKMLPLFPAAVERLDVGAADLVISSSSAFAHGVRPRPGAVHVSYCHSPFRYVWHERSRALAEFPRGLRRAGGLVLDRIRAWDVAASERVTHYIANSRVTQTRIAEFYGREAAIVHPPVDVDRWKGADPAAPGDQFLIVGEVVRHKNIDVALEAARIAGKRVTVVGTGPDRARLEREYAGVATFVGRVSDRDLEGLYSRSQALLVMAVEEFGITAVEAMAAGRPVLAAGAGGALETVRDGVTGVLVPLRDVSQTAAAMHDVDWGAFASPLLREHAQQFSVTSFRTRLLAEVERLSGCVSACGQRDR